MGITQIQRDNLIPERQSTPTYAGGVFPLSTLTGPQHIRLLLPLWSSESNNATNEAKSRINHENISFASEFA